MNEDILRAAGRGIGRADALNLRNRAGNMSGTAIIDEEIKIPVYNPDKDYSTWPAGAPVSDEDQIWQLLQPHNAAAYEGRPSGLRTLWSLCHTTNPARAKPWAAAFGTSGMYQPGECYKAEDGTVYRCKSNDVVRDAAAQPSAWEILNEQVRD